MKDLKAIPNLDEIGHDPTLAAGLPADVRQALTARAIGALNALYAASLADGATGQAERSADGDRLLAVKDAAKKIGKSEAYLYRNADRYPFTVRDGRSLRFSEAGIEKWIRARTGR